MLKFYMYKMPGVERFRHPTYKGEESIKIK